MEITEVRLFLKDGNDKKLKAYATITIDNAFVVRNVKVIEGNKGLFVAMPSRKIKESCPKCNFKNTVRSKFCNQCGSVLPPPKKIETTNPKNRESEHKDIAHPISFECRDYIQKKVLEAYDIEKKKQGSQPVSQPVSGPGTQPSSISREKPKFETPGAASPNADMEGDLAL
ncbi:MAG: hypothetical protein COS99_01275 [Candidatus Omnitrophica bacterium CG07_land_8_20_14_0_80_42_15]|uniref:Stage V sporulation protein G n=1 Tax=Candidatus Aquitaenariimonas noxiae TaxID=1974741 RepID=A0A2J0L2E0_9BACT|nr:MAG: hypothetical protein COS99_01275 [Candidatus Omnitrophica bacterium CG07_land_8_20_14_0_80_42_15]